MAIIDRLGRLFRADVHAVLDRLEAPEILLKQAIRDMEEELASDAARLKARELDLAQGRARAEQLGAALAKLASELDLAFGADNDALVRTLLKRRIETERLAALVARRCAALESGLAASREKHAERRRELDALRQKAELFETQAAPAEGCGASVDAAEFAVSDADVELALLRERQARRPS